MQRGLSTHFEAPGVHSEGRTALSSYTMLCLARTSRREPATDFCICCIAHLQWRLIFAYVALPIFLTANSTLRKASKK